jgi:hypothetical protein
MAFCRARAAAFRAEMAMEMETGSLALWPEREEAKKQEWWTRRVECQGALPAGWRRQQVGRESRNLGR